MDVTDPKWLKIKGVLFLFLGLLAVGTIILLMPRWEVFLLLAIGIWAFCRFYYFAFYVLHHYVDPEFKYAGLLDLAKYLLKVKRK